jgi:formylglycine-generating enzyme required for sulfatase activity
VKKSTEYLAVLLLALPCLAEQATTTNSQGMTLRFIPAGIFERGTPSHKNLRNDFARCYTNNDSQTGDEQHSQMVRLTQPFYLADREVTRGQFRAFIAATGHVPTVSKDKRGMVGFKVHQNKHRQQQHTPFKRDKAFSWESTGFLQDDNHPVVGVSFVDVTAYCAWLSEKEGKTYRLPTEAEWEYACRARTSTWFSFGDKPLNVIEDYANLGDVSFNEKYPAHLDSQRVFANDDRADGHVFTAPVGSFKPNRWGLYDMHGNVWEWCADYYSFNYYKNWLKKNDYKTVVWVDPFNTEQAKGAAPIRVIRGGSWFTTAMSSRSARRGFFEPQDAAAYIGFRVAMTASVAEIEAAAKDVAEKEKSVAELTAAGFQIGVYKMLKSQARTPKGSSLRHLELLQKVPYLAILRGSHQQSAYTAQHIAAISKLSDLEVLEARALDVIPGKNQLAPLGSLTKLRELSLPWNSTLVDADLAFLSQLQNLEEISCHGSGVTDAALRHLSSAKLKVLRVHGSPIGAAGLAQLTTTRLERIQLEVLGDAEAEALRRFPIIDMDAQSKPLTDAGIESISKLTRLERLHLNGANQPSPESFAQLKALTRIGILDVTGTQAGDSLAEAMYGSRYLKIFVIGSSNLTDAGMAHIGRLYFLTRLHITKDATAITDASFETLANLRRLEELIVEAPQINAAAVQALKELPQFKDLKITVR